MKDMIRTQYDSSQMRRPAHTPTHTHTYHNILVAHTARSTHVCVSGAVRLLLCRVCHKI